MFAIAGIGQPNQFFDGLRAAGWNVTGTRAFPDHHRYTAADLSQLADAVTRSGADLVVTTEKDAVRLRELREFPFSWVAIPLTLELDPPDTLFACTRAALERASKRLEDRERGSRRP